MSRLLLIVTLGTVCLVAADPPADETTAADEHLLKSAGIPADAPGLLAFFRKRTLTDADRANVAKLIAQLGSETFDDREEASKRLIAFGTSVLPVLREAAKSDDAELSRRAREAVDTIDAASRSGLAGAAARMLARVKPAGATGALLAYLPFADDLAVEEDVQAALLSLNPAPGKTDPALVPALTAKHPSIRGAGGHVLGQNGDEAQRAAVHKLLADRVASVRFRAAVALITARDRSAVPPLIDLVGEDLGILSWQVEDALFRLAGEQAPAISVGLGAADARLKARDAWRGWWKESGDKVDLSGFKSTERLIGYTLGIEYNSGRVWEVGPDHKIRWEIKGLLGPMEAQILPGGRVLIAESNSRTISERDYQGAVAWKKVLTQEPTGVQRLPNGNTFVSTYGSAMEFDRNGTTVFDIKFPNGGSNAIRKARNGNVIYTQDAEITEVDSTGKKVRSIPLPKQSMWVGLRDLPGDRFLVGNSGTGRILEIDAAGKILWEGTVPGVCGIAKLPNGHVLVGTANLVVELAPDGKRVWEMPCPGYVRRIHRR